MTEAQLKRTIRDLRRTAETMGARAAFDTITAQSQAYSIRCKPLGLTVCAIRFGNGVVLLGQGPTTLDAQVHALREVWPLAEHPLRELLEPGQ